MAGTNPSQRSEALNGYRALAIMVVMLAHTRFGDAYPPWMRPFEPFLRGGVTAFMVLSGYLITHLLLSEEAKRGKVDVLAFFGGQVVRFFAPTVPYLAVALLVWGLPEAGFQWWPSLRILWASPWTGDGFHGATALTGHLYSLAAQTQFCIWWPPLLMVIPPARRLLSVTLLMLAAATWRILGRELAIAHNETQQRTDYVFGSLMVGAWWAIAVTKGRMDWILRLTRARLLPIFGGALLILAFTRSPSAFVELISPELRQAVAPWRQVPVVAVSIRVVLSLVSMLAFGCLAFLLHQGRPVRVAQVFAWPGITWLGRISFSVYLWQNVFCFGVSNLKIGSVRLDDFPINMVASVVCGYLSYRLLELPSLKFRSWVKQRIRSRNGTGDSSPSVTPT